MNIKCQWDLIMAKISVVQLLGCHDLNMADGEFKIKRTAISYVVYSIQTGHYIKESHPLLEHAFIEIVNTTKVHR